MNKNIEYLPDGTINFYQNKYANLIVAIASLMGLVIFALILFFLELYKEKSFIFAFGFMALIEIPFIIFFLFRFFKPKQEVFISINSQHIAIQGKELAWDQIKLVKADGVALVFYTKDNKNHIFRKVLYALNKESQAILRDILSKHGLNY